MNLSMLSKLVESSKMNKSQIANACGITPTTLYNVLSGADAKISTIESLARVLKVPVSSLFDESDKVNIKFNEIEVANQEIERLRAEIEVLRSKRGTAKVVVEIDVDEDEFVKMGLKDKVIQVLNK